MNIIDNDNYKLTDNEIIDYIDNIALENEWDIYSISTNQFNYILERVGSRFFADTSILFIHPQQLNVDIIDKLCNIYISLCYKYNKSISVYNFCNMLNISYEFLEVWKSADVTSCKYKIIKTLTDKREQYIKDKLTDSNNVVGAIAVANNEYKWTNGSNSGNTTINVLSGSSLPDLIAKIADNNGVQALPPSE